MARDRKTFSGDFRTFFFRGLGILLPSILTLWLLWQAGLFLLNTVAEPINKGVRGTIVWVIPTVVPNDRLPNWFTVDDKEVAAFRLTRAGRDLEGSSGGPPTDSDVREAVRRARLATLWNNSDILGFKLLDTVGLLIAIVLLYLAGALLGGFIGRRVYGRLEQFLSRLPGFKQIYPHIKQLVDLIIGERQMAFRRTVMVEYPGPGVWTVGFVTGDSMRSVSSIVGEPCVAVFIPTSPTPMTGFTVNIRESKVQDLDLSIDEALRYVITAGVLVPDRHKPLDSGANGPVAEEAGTDEPGRAPNPPAPMLNSADQATKADQASPEGRDDGGGTETKSERERDSLAG